MIPTSGGTAVITGASSGIGWHLSLALAKSGMQLALLARREQRLRELAKIITAKGGRRPLECVCDVGDLQQVEAVQARIVDEVGPVDVIVNNAGRGAYGPFVSCDPEDVAAVVQTNVIGVLHVTRAFLPDMIVRRSGHLVFVSSVLGELPAPRHAVYGSTKFAVTAFAESLRYELAADNIHVTTIEPGLVSSEFASVSGTPSARFEQLPSKTPERTAALIAAAIRRKDGVQVTDRLSAFAIKVRRHMPRLFRIVFGKLYRRTVREDPHL